MFALEGFLAKVKSQRVRYRTGPEVEWGIADERWLSVQPLDGPTAKVLAAGVRVVHDPHGRLQALIDAVQA